MTGMPFFKVLKTYIPFFIGFLLFIYVVIRAIVLPITHDESNTCLVYSTMSIKDIMFYKIPIPNNHIFNTLLIKLSRRLFGWSNLSVRLPNVLGFLLYYFCVVALLRKMNDDFMFILLGIVIMYFNPFLLDFFSMARGYALAVSFMITSILFAVNYFETSTIKNLAAAVLLAALSVYTNFTLLNFYVAFIVILGLCMMKESGGKAFSKIIILVVITVVLGVLSYIPVIKMLATDQFRFWKSGGFYSGTIKSLIISSSYRTELPVSLSSITVPLGILFFILSIALLTSLWKNKSFNIRTPNQFFSLLLVATVLVNIAHFYIAGTPYLSGRTALFYIPLFGLTIMGFIAWLMGHKIKFLKQVMSFIIISGMAHLFTTVNLSYCYEWSYDANTYDVIAFLKKEYEHNPDKVITLSTNWRFYPSFKFYIETEKLDWLKIEDFHNVIRPNSNYQYYYTVSEEAKELGYRYSKLFSFASDSRILMKLK